MSRVPRADASLYASLFPQVAGKQCVVYKAVMEESEDQFSRWLHSSTTEHGNCAFNLVGGASSSVTYAGERLAPVVYASCWDTGDLL